MSLPFLWTEICSIAYGLAKAKAGELGLRPDVGRMLAPNTFLNIGAAYPNQTFTGWIPPASPVSKLPLLSGIEGKHVKITGRIEMYEGKPEIRINAAEQLEVE